MKIVEIQLQTQNIADTEIFYRSVLATLPDVKTDTELHYTFGHSRLVFFETATESPKYHIAFNIPCNQIQNAKAWMEAKVNLLPLSPGEVLTDFINWNAKSFYFYDNNGNILELIARFDLQNEQTGAFDASNILSISEVGIMTDDVPAFADMLAQAHKIPYFRNFVPSEDFTAMGDDNALLIVVKKHRNWYPTAVAAVANPLKIIVEHQHKTCVFDFA